MNFSEYIIIYYVIYNIYIFVKNSVEILIRIGLNFQIDFGKTLV